jgi:hypothetical protein
LSPQRILIGTAGAGTKGYIADRDQYLRWAQMMCKISLAVASDGTLVTR